MSSAFNFQKQDLRGGTRNAVLACGSKVLHFFIYRGFSPDRAKILDKRKKKYRSAEG
jgi:hypothetical protein